MVKRNPNAAQLKEGYLFPEIHRRKHDLLKRVPDAKIISLGIGNTTEPLTPHIAGALEKAARDLSTLERYSGYGDEQGIKELRVRLARKIYRNRVDPDEVFVSDGAKCDVGRLQFLFSQSAPIAVQDPSYPAYVDSGLLCGQKVSFLRCSPENDFIPDLDKITSPHVIYICSPNNPTGAVADKAQLKELVEKTKSSGSILVFDAAYSMFIQDDQLPKSIYEIDGAKEAAIEVNSFSKPAGFTGVRLGWTVVPKELRFEDGESVHQDWRRVITTIFNGASNIAQQGGMAVLDETGLSEIQNTVRFYMENARLLRACLDGLGFESYGGDNAPYIWTRFQDKNSWDVFEEFLEKAHIVTTPGAGFGPGGEGFVRFSAFGHRQDVEEAIARLKGMF